MGFFFELGGMKGCLSLLLGFVVGVMGYGQTNYYVSPMGNNGNVGSLAAPWQTVQHGLNQLLTLDTLNLMAGTFYEKVYIPNSNIALRNQAGQAPVLDATGILTQTAIIEVLDVSNVTIQGLELKNNSMLDAQGILVEGNCRDITIQSCTIHDIHFSSNPNAVVDSSTNAQGIIVYGTSPTNPIRDLIIQDNHIYDCRLGYSEGIAVNGNVDGFHIIGNLVHDLTNIGIDCIGHEGTCPDPLLDQARNGIVQDNITHHCISFYAPSAGIYVDGGRNIILENNTTYHNGYGIEVGCENVGKTTDGISVRSNIIHDNEFSGMAWGGFDYPSGSGKVTNSSFTNNTCFRNGTGTQTYGEMYLSYSEGSVIHTNIFSAFGSNIWVRAENTQPGLFFDYNIVHGPSGAAGLYNFWPGLSASGFAGFVTGSQTNANSQFIDPAFVATQVGSVDLHLTAGSPAIDAGNPFFIPQPGEVDMDNQTRNFGFVDCGADEFYSSNGIATPADAQVLQLYPNPATTTLYLDAPSEPATLTLYNAFGQMVHTGPVHAGQGIDIAMLPPGVYLAVCTPVHGVPRSARLIKH
jgi:hypothetical protein